MIRLGLRFRRGDAKVLRNVAERVKLHEIPGGADLYLKAASAAQMGEPLLVLCEQPEEAIEIAQAFALVGVKPPVVEALTALK